MMPVAMMVITTMTTKRMTTTGGRSRTQRVQQSAPWLPRGRGRPLVPRGLLRRRLLSKVVQQKHTLLQGTTTASSSTSTAAPHSSTSTSLTGRSRQPQWTAALALRGTPTRSPQRRQAAMAMATAAPTGSVGILSGWSLLASAALYPPVYALGTTSPTITAKARHINGCIFRLARRKWWMIAALAARAPLRSRSVAFACGPSSLTLEVDILSTPHPVPVCALFHRTTYNFTLPRCKR